MLALLAANAVNIVQALLMILGGFSILAKISPTPKDDKLVDKALAVVHLLGLTK